MSTYKFSFLRIKKELKLQVKEKINCFLKCKMFQKSHNLKQNKILGARKKSKTKQGLVKKRKENSPYLIGN